MDGARAGRLAARASLAAVIVLAHVQWACGSCQKPITPQEGLTCDSGDVDYFKSSSPDTWWTATTPPDKYVPGIDYIKNYYQCCRHCMWSFEYPSAAPIVAIVTDELDCVRFQKDFARYNTEDSGRGVPHLTASELEQYLQEGPNAFLIENKFLDPAQVALQADLDKDGNLTKEEFLTLRHYWALVHVTKMHPAKANDLGGALRSGPLGGFFYDIVQLQSFFTVLVGSMIEQYYDNLWDPSLVREPSAMELADVMRKMDIDGSERISFEEHYFRIFADRDGDGFVSKNEYYASLYPKLNLAGVADNPYLLPFNFNQHDTNYDGKVSFMERKFIASDQDLNQRLTYDEWIKGDFPMGFGPFENHALPDPVVDGELSVDAVRFESFLHFHQCASYAELSYASETSASVSHPWSRACIINILIANDPPFVTMELDNSTRACGSEFCNYSATENPGHTCSKDEECGDLRACSYFGYCHSWDVLEPKGVYLRKRRWIQKPSGYLIDVVQEISYRLRYNVTFTPLIEASPSPLSSSQDVSILRATASTMRSIPTEKTKMAWPLPTDVVLSSSYSQRHLDAKGVKIDQSQYACTDTLWPQDGFVIVAHSNPSIISQQLALLLMLISSSFVNFISFFLLLLLFMGHLFWLCERGQNPDQFRPFYSQGVMDGLWFSAVTVTTVGYGDKAPITGFGRLIDSFWMIFGLISFGIFGGAVVSDIADMQANQIISDVSSLKGITVAVLMSSSPKRLSNLFSMKVKECETIEQCAQWVANEDVKAMLVPHTDFVAFQRSSAAYGTESSCKSPFRRVGDPLLADDRILGQSATLCMCDKCDLPVAGTSIHESHYLKEGFERSLEVLKSEGFLDSLHDEYFADGTEGCEQSSGYDIVSLSIMLTLILLTFSLEMFFSHSYTKDYAERLHNRATTYLDKLLVLIGMKVKKFHIDEDERWISHSSDERDHKIFESLDRMKAADTEYDQQLQALKQETIKGRETTKTVLSFFTISGSASLCLLSTCFTVLVMVWGTQIRPVFLGLTAGSAVMNEL